MERSERVKKKLDQLTGESASSFVDGICLQYLESRDKDDIHTPIIHTSRLTISIQRYHDEVLQLIGVCAELDKVAAVEADVRVVTRWLEELLCTAMVDYEEVVTTYKARGFGFQ